MNAPDETDAVTARASILRAVQTPLGFFCLTVLIVETIFGTLAAITNEWTQRLLVYAMIGIILLLILIVAGMAVFRPGALTVAATTTPITRSPASEFQRGDFVVIMKPKSRQIIKSWGVIGWSSSMDEFVGQSTRISSFQSNKKIAKLELDSGRHDWAAEWIQRTLI